MTDKAQRKRRGSREAMHAKRRAPLPQDQQPVLPGLEGGRYHILNESDITQIEAAVYEVLETIGMANAIPSCIDLVCKAGGHYTKEGRLLFPEKLIEQTLQICAKDITLHALNENHSMDLSGEKLYFGSAGAAVHIVDPFSGQYRDSTLEDLYNIARLVDTLDHIHFFQRPIVARDMLNPRDLDINTCYAAISATNKHIGSSWGQPEHLEESLRMLHMIAGGEDAWRDKPFVSMSSCFAVPPLRFAEDACECLETAIKGGMPVLLLSAGQAGATSPASLAGSVVQSIAEVLAGFCYSNLIQPGHPVLFGTWPFVSDLRTGAMSGGSGEQAVLMTAVGQMGRHFGLPTGIAAGMADAKLPDAQSGYEKAYNIALAAHCGTNLIYEAAGMHASLLGCCYESYIIDNDMLGAINRTVRGLEVNRESLSIEVMRDVCIDGPNHYLGHQQTIDLMQREYLYPLVADRNSPKEWEEKNKPNLLDTARSKVEKILASHFPTHIDCELDRHIREQFNIKLPRSAMNSLKG